MWLTNTLFFLSSCLPFGSSFLSGSFKYRDYLQAEYKALFFLFYHLSESDLIHTHNFN